MPKLYCNGDSMEFQHYIDPPIPGLEDAYKALFTIEARQFVCEMYLHFEKDIQNLYSKRTERRNLSLKDSYTVKFRNSAEALDPKWRIASLPRRLENRHLDLGDVSPANMNHLKTALKTNVQGIQVDFDDGHCPTWKNQVTGLYNVYKIVHNQIEDMPKICDAPILMLRPRAWNMLEHHFKINGKSVPGPIMDFAILMYHNANILINCESGPFFYLSKLEGANEAKLWNDIFVWTQTKLNIPQRTIKVCVLIENILSSFEIDQILFELRNHAIGLNCGIWDYAASIINKFGHNKEFILPDRNKYVNMQRHFLKRYLQLIVRACHQRGAHATGGMYAKMLPAPGYKMETFFETQKALKSKHVEIVEGIDGFMVYDLRLVPYMNELWKTECGLEPNQISKPLSFLRVNEEDLIKMPDGGVTLEGLIHNVRVAILFILNWLDGQGLFIYQDCVEDSATAEISRSQVWQWLKHNAAIELQDGKTVTLDLVKKLINDYTITLETDEKLIQKVSMIRDAARLFLEIITIDPIPEFITSFLNDHHIFKRYHDFGAPQLTNISHKI